jgi:hypothetical protein
VYIGETVSDSILELEWLFYSEDGNSSFLRDVVTLIPNHTASLPGRLILTISWS